LIESLLDQTNPFAIITAAHLKTKATKNNPQERYTWKWTITRALYEKGFSTKDILALYRLVDWLMMLPDDLTKKFTQDLIAYEEEKKMPYITSAERIGIEKGRLEGRTEGLDLGRDEGMLFNAREMLLEALDEKFSSNTPADIKKQIQALNNKIMLKRLLRSSIESKDIEEFRKTLEELTAQDPA
jgi:flagellar biosynthesis/type III secretory pathway protein FliH